MLFQKSLCLQVLECQESITVAVFACKYPQLFVFKLPLFCFPDNSDVLHSADTENICNYLIIYLVSFYWNETVQCFERHSTQNTVF